MSDELHAAKRRSVLRTTAGVLTGTALAGCLEGETDESDADEDVADGASENGGDGETNTDTDDGSSTDSAADEARTASIEPVGSVTVEGPPERVVGEWGVVADILTALGHPDAIVGMSRPGFWYRGFYDELPGVTAPDPDEIPNTVTESYRLSEEQLLTLDPDLLATDPNRWMSSYGVDPDDIERYDEDVAPFFGNYSNQERGDGWPNWPDGEYPYYTLAELTEAYGQLFGEADRAAAINEFRTEVLERITSRLPPESERPAIGLLNAFRNPEDGDPFGVYDPLPERPGTYARKHYADLGVADAFSEHYEEENPHFDLRVGYEGLLEIDPDVIIFHNAVAALDGDTVYGSASAYESTLDALRSNSAGQQLTAVTEDRLYPGGTSYQGPIVNLFQTEMLAKQLYPEEFGEWRGPNDVPPDEQLFDREELAAIITE